MTQDVQEARRELRAHAMTAREELSPEFRHQSSVEIIERLKHYLTGKKCQVLHCYISFRSEVETREFIEAAIHDGTRMIVPVVDQSGAEETERTDRLTHTEIRELTGLAKGRFGLEEPIEREPSSLESLDAVIVPIVAFDRRGTRLGYGKGFYDVFLRELPRSVERIGLAFSAQEVKHIPALPHDEPLDTIITEREIIHATEP
ncbi:MAG TPA: 5-formyltetrahydrofolate cyclo-ligase [Candidatus Kapabacteria bacterium]|nr:5-formyltetrahydrofolate cyclo-ligase [Candidatus Kapabacteria bacterium]